MHENLCCYLQLAIPMPMTSCLRTRLWSVSSASRQFCLSYFTWQYRQLVRSSAISMYKSSHGNSSIQSKLPILTHIPNSITCITALSKQKDQSIVIHFIYALCIAVNKETRTSPHQKWQSYSLADKNCSGMMPSEMLRDV